MSNIEILEKMVFSACLVSCAVAVADALKPSDKFNRQLKMIFSALFLCGLLAPAVSGGFSLDLPVNGSADSEIYNEIDTDAELKKAIEDNIRKTAEEILNQDEISFKKVSVLVNINEDNSIDINEICICSSEFEKAAECLKSQLGKGIRVTEIEQD
mgnify:CR=1 FL=1